MQTSAVQYTRVATSLDDIKLGFHSTHSSTYNTAKLILQTATTKCQPILYCFSQFLSLRDIYNDKKVTLADYGRTSISKKW